MNGSTRSLRVVSFNIAGWNLTQLDRGQDGLEYDIHEQAELVRKQSPDIVAFQEVRRFSTRSKYPKMDRVKEMATLLNMPFFVYHDVPEDHTGARTHYGVSVISRWPVRDAGFFEIPTDGHPPYRRLVVHATVLPDNGSPPFIFCSLHLQHSSRGADDRKMQAQRIYDHFLDEKLPVIIAGDFNCRPDSEPMRILTQSEGWKDTTRHDIDAVLVKPKAAWHPIEKRIVDSEGRSDHPLVLSVLEYTR